MKKLNVEIAKISTITLFLNFHTSHQFLKFGRSISILS